MDQFHPYDRITPMNKILLILNKYSDGWLPKEPKIVFSARSLNNYDGFRSHSKTSWFWQKQFFLCQTTSHILCNFSPMRCSKALFIETYELFVDLQLLKSVICCVEYHNWVNSQDLNRYTKLLKVVHSKSTILLNRNRSTVVEVINQ